MRSAAHQALDMHRTATVRVEGGRDGYEGAVPKDWGRLHPDRDRVRRDLAVEQERARLVQIRCDT